VSAPRPNFLGQTRQALTGYFADLGERSYRVTQAMKWVYHRDVDGFEAMSDIGKRVRDRMAADFEIRLPEIVTAQVSKDGTRKWSVRVANGQAVECVLIPEKGRNTLCVSSQIGCMLDCSFCSTGKQGFAGNLEAGDIVGQVLLVERELARVHREGALARGEPLPGELGYREWRRQEDAGAEPRGVTNVVLMGMGEPLLNFDNVLAATGLMMDDLAFGISKRRVTVSTAGVVPGIYALAAQSDVSLAVSLHAPDDALRDELVPINRKYPIAELLEACRHYQDTSLGERRSVTFEYTLLDGVNDQLSQARDLARLLRAFPCKINLIPFNPFPGSSYDRPAMERVRAFQTVLMQSGYATMLRTTRGDDIDAACGQLVGRFADRTRRRERHLARTGLAGDDAARVPIVEIGP
jgi:23S rRNA (adenine2503-C2)-methyltransferase